MRRKSHCMLPKSVVNLDDTDDGLCNTKHLVSTLETRIFSTRFLDETYRGRQYCMVVPSWNVQ